MRARAIVERGVGPSVKRPSFHHDHLSPILGWSGQTALPKGTWSSLATMPPSNAVSMDGFECFHGLRVLSVFAYVHASANVFECHSLLPRVSSSPERRLPRARAFADSTTRAPGRERGKIKHLITRFQNKTGVGKGRRKTEAISKHTHMKQNNSFLRWVFMGRPTSTVVFMVAEKRRVWRLIGHMPTSSSISSLNLSPRRQPSHPPRRHTREENQHTRSRDNNKKNDM